MGNRRETRGTAYDYGQHTLGKKAGRRVQAWVRSVPAKNRKVEIVIEVVAPMAGKLTQHVVDVAMERGPEWAAEAAGKAKDELSALGARVRVTARERRVTRQRRRAGEAAIPSSETTGSQEAKPMKYDPLREYLSREPADRVTMSFANVEAVIRASLPASALSHRAWWANEQEGQHVQAQAWLVAGRAVEDVDLAAKSVTFIRSSAE